MRATIDLIPDVLIESLDLIEQGTATWTPQNLDDRTFFHKRSARDSIVDWRWSAEDLDRFVRALSDPVPERRHLLAGPADPNSARVGVALPLRRHPGPGVHRRG